VKQVAALAVGIVGTLGLGYLLAHLGGELALAVTAALVVAAVGVILLPWAYGLILVVVEVLASGFLIVLLAWAHHAAAQQEYGIAGFQFLAIVSTLAVWLTASSLKAATGALRQKDAAIAALSRHSADGTVLSTAEFHRIARLISAATRRHHEPATLIELHLRESPVHRSLRAYLAKSVVQVTRADFDVVGELDPHTIGILLQDCDDTGATVVLERLWRVLAEAAVTTEARDLISVDIRPMPWADAEANTAGPPAARREVG
jgi:hypothetical protein